MFEAGDSADRIARDTDSGLPAVPGRLRDGLAALLATALLAAVLLYRGEGPVLAGGAALAGGLFGWALRRAAVRRLHQQLRQEAIALGGALSQEDLLALSRARFGRRLPADPRLRGLAARLLAEELTARPPYRLLPGLLIGTGMFTALAVTADPLFWVAAAWSVVPLLLTLLAPITLGRRVRQLEAPPPPA
jgi:hypothetical protein